jgi:hypothetical protein
MKTTNENKKSTGEKDTLLKTFNSFKYRIFFVLLLVLKCTNAYSQNVIKVLGYNANGEVEDEIDPEKYNKISAILKPNTAAPMTVAAMIVLGQVPISVLDFKPDEDSWRRQEAKNVYEYIEIFKNLKSRGYKIELITDPVADDFLDAFRSTETVALLHEGHGIRHPEKDLYILKIGEEKLSIDEITSYLQKNKIDSIKAGKNLRFVFTKACFGGNCRKYYIPKFSLPEINFDKRPHWIGSFHPINLFNTKETVNNLEYAIQNNLPKKAPKPVNLKQGPVCTKIYN